jgi:glycerophosphoryl diester phosphodiesterase
MTARHQTRVIAHRGASGYLPEHTLAAKCLAYGMGADFLEQDVVACRDGTLVVLHDVVLDDVTDVASCYADRRRSDGHFYVIDFDMAELRRLRLQERRRPGTDEPLFAGRYSGEQPDFGIVSLADELSLVRGLNATTGRRVGVYPEIKAPAFHAEHGIELGPAVLGQLERSGWLDGSAPVFVQCFDADTLLHLHAQHGASLPLVQLLDKRGAERLEADPDGIDRVARYAVAVGLPYECLLVAFDARSPRTPLRASRLAARLHDAGLAIHPYTFRRETFAGNPEGFRALLDFFIHEIEVDGLFCDQADIAVAARDRPH